MSEVTFSERQKLDNLTIYSKNLDDFNWKNRVVGLTDAGFLYVDERVAKLGDYDIFPKVLPWSEVHEVATSRCISFRGILFGVAGLMMAFFVFSAGWIKQTHTGLGIYLIPPICGAAGLAFVFGAIRNRIVVKTADRSFKWISLPLSVKRTLPLCRDAAAKAQAHGVQRVQTHA